MNSIRGFFAGSGIGAFSNSDVIDRLLHMVQQHRARTTTATMPAVLVAYIGTPTYDLPEQQYQQTHMLEQRGCMVQPIQVADPHKTCITADEDATLRAADVVLVSGGNTLYAVRRWAEVGLDHVLREVAQAGHAVLAGGSAGAICWFTSGHSDSADPTTYMKPMLMNALGKQDGEAEPTASTAASWSYIRVQGTDLLPGMLCPHFDVTQSNGVRRSEDFSKMLRRHPTERGIALDHWAVLILNGNGTYDVFAVPGKSREPTNNDADTTPGVFTLEVQGSQLHQQRVPVKGKVDELLRAPTGPLVRDPFELFHAMENPTASSGSLLSR